MILNFNNSLYERDMDLLFSSAIMTEPEFCKIFIAKTDLKDKTFRVLSVDLSRADSDLGESDITVVIESDGIKYALLIEDKIDAIAMPRQHERYVERGRKDVKVGEYSDFRIFIICPEKYYKNNDEAKLYEHHVSYEECKKYFDDKNDPLSALRSQQLDQAITKAKKPPTNNVDENANAFLRQYIRYQTEHYPSLDRSTKEDRNGWWVEYRTELGRVWVVHKIREGRIDLTFSRASDKIGIAKTIAEWARRHKMPDVTAVKAGKSAIIRVHVPKLDMAKGFEAIDKDELNECFEVLKELTEFANIIEMANSITLR